MPLRLPCLKQPGGARVEVLILGGQADQAGLWKALLKPGRRARAGTRLVPVRNQEPGACFVVEDKSGDGIYFLRWTGPEPLDTPRLEKIGLPPLPPYIRREYFLKEDEGGWEKDRQWYQTVFARHPGSAAAPTAGLHFSSSLLEALRGKGIRMAEVTLHVGPGTFLPVKEDDPQGHLMHEEEFVVTPEAARIINETRKSGKKVVAVGTTSLRVLESASDEAGLVFPHAGKTGLFILPGYRFKAVDALLTNFHVPFSTLLMLVSAFDDTRRILSLYEECVEKGYRFLSYGDVMLIV
jgi:S-adenosylmethionine:tRNA ribosyltransferase-isomerase